MAAVDRYARGAGGWLPHGYDGVNAMLAPTAPVATERFELVRSEGRDGRGVSIERFLDAKAGAVLLRLCSDDEVMVEAMRADDSMPIRIGSIEEVLRDGSRVCHVRYRYAADAGSRRRRQGASIWSARKMPLATRATTAIATTC